MEEKEPKSAGSRDDLTVPDSICGDAQAVFAYWYGRGVDSPQMLQRVMDMFDADPKGAEQIFGVGFMDTIDYFTHYWG